MPPRGVIAAGHPVTAQTGADVLRAGGNAVDAAVAAVCASFTAEPVLIDFFVAAPGRGADAQARAELVPVDVSFGDAIQRFHIGPASVGCYGLPAGLAEATARFGSLPLADLVAPGAALARDGVALSHEQAYVVEILDRIVMATPECAALFAPGGSLLREGEVFRNPELGDALERLGRDGPAPFYTGDVAAAVTGWLEGTGALLTAADLAAYRAVDRAPVRVAYRGREVVLNPPPSAGGTLIAYALALLERTPGPADPLALVTAMGAAQDERTPEFLEGLAEPGFLDRFMAARLGSTTHLSVLDAEGRGASVTCSNGEGAGIVVPGTGIHLNNMLGEHDLNPLGFHRHPPGRRMPSMMCPAAVLEDGRPELVLGSGGSNRIRSAITQTIVGVIDRHQQVAAAIEAPRVHFEDGVVYHEPDADVTGLAEAGWTLAPFGARNLFFGGVQAVRRDPGTGELSGGADPRRGGAVVVA